MRTGQRHSDATKKQISESRKGKTLGHPFWGGDGVAMQKARRERAIQQLAARPVRTCEKTGCSNTWQVEQSSPKRYCCRACAYADKPSVPLQERFWTKVAKGNPDECWLWTGSLTNSGGYGQLSRSRAEGPVRANRVSYEMHIGPIPDGLSVLHRCDTPACVNPAHLFLGTTRDNARDMSRKGRWKNQSAAGPNHVPFNQHRSA